MNKILCGVDLGGTKLSIGLIDQDGSIIDKIIIYDHVAIPEYLVIEKIAKNVNALLTKKGFDESDLMGIGMGFPGHLRYYDGITITTSNLEGFKDFPLRDEMKKHFKIPVLIDNDANAQAFAEFKFGAGKGNSSLIFLTISTGIGAGIILNGKIFRGQTGTAGEFGHTIVDPYREPPCTCGNHGCLMSCACGLALPHMFRAKLDAGTQTRMHIPNDIDEINGEFIKIGLDQGDQICREIVLECADYIGIGLYNIFQVFNPPILVLGGGLMNWGDVYFDRIKKKFYSLVKEMLYDPIQIMKSEFVSDAGLIGAASLLLE